MFLVPRRRKMVELRLADGLLLLKPIPTIVFLSIRDVASYVCTRVAMGTPVHVDKPIRFMVLITMQFFIDQ